MNKKKLKRREEKEKIQKLYKKGKIEKSQGVWSHRYILTPKYCRKNQQRFDGWGRGKGPHISQPLWSRGKKKLWMWAAKVRQILLISGGRIISSEAAMGGGGVAQRPVWCGNELKKTGARNARARMRGQNPLVEYYTVTSD